MLTPDKLAKSGTEHGEQTAVFGFLAVAKIHGFEAARLWSQGMTMAQIGLSKPIPELKWAHAIPNGGSRGDDAKSRAIRGGQLKAEGVTTGVSDICWPVRRGVYSGLYVEMKVVKHAKSKNGGASEDQLQFIEFVKGQGFAAGICHGWAEAVDVFERYWNGTL